MSSPCRATHPIITTHNLRRVPVHHNLRNEYLLGEQQHQPDIHLNHRHRVHADGVGESLQATAGASPTSPPSGCQPPFLNRTSPFRFRFSPLPSYSTNRPHHPRPSNIITSLPTRCHVNTTALHDLTSCIPADKLVSAKHAAYADKYGQQYLVGGMRLKDVQILSRAGDRARERRRRRRIS